MIHMVDDLVDEAQTEIRPYLAVLSGGYGMPYEFSRGDMQQPANDEALIRLDFSGVCHGDIYTRDGGGPAPALPRRPLTGGHEGVGQVVALGSLKKSDCKFSVGDRVGVAWRSSTCGKCQACSLRARNHCPRQQLVGMHRNGTFQQYLAFPLKELIRLPQNIDLASACPILCARVTSYVAVRKMNPERGKWCAISGVARGVGHLAVQYAKTVFGLKVLAIDGGSRGKEDFADKWAAMNT